MVRELIGRAQDELFMCTYQYSQVTISRTSKIQKKKKTRQFEFIFIPLEILVTLDILTRSRKWRKITQTANLYP